MAETAAHNRLRFDLDRLPPGSRHDLELDVVELANGEVLRIPVLVLCGREAGPRLAAIAGVHGDEPEGALALLEAWERIEPDAVRGTLTMVPVANPPAFAAARRRSPLDDLDLNRTFPGRPEGSASERIAHRLFDAVVRRADFVFSLHSWSVHGTVAPFVEVGDGDDPVSRDGLAAALACGFERVRRLDWPAGLMVKVANAEGIPGIEVELGGMGISLPENRARYRAHILSLMRHLGMLEGEAAPHPGARVFRGRHLLAPRGGVLDLAVRLEDEVAEGGLVARIRDLHGRCVVEVRAPLAGLVAAHRTFIPVAPGDHVVTLFHDGTPA